MKIETSGAKLIHSAHPLIMDLPTLGMSFYEGAYI